MGTFQLWWEAQKEVIFSFTGLSPTTFFTGLAILFALIYVVSGLFGSSSSSDRHHQTRHIQAEVPPLRPPVQLGEITEEELKAYDGNDHDKPLLMAIKGQIYDVSQSRFSITLFLWFSVNFIFLIPYCVADRYFWFFHI